eukprot:792086_1
MEGNDDEKSTLQGDEQNYKIMKGKLSFGELSVSGNCKTGWNKPVEKLNFGQEGIVGHNYWALDIITDFGTNAIISGFRCDYDKNPVNIMFSDDGKNWRDGITIAKYENMLTVFNKPIKGRYGRMIWM